VSTDTAGVLARGLFVKRVVPLMLAGCLVADAAHAIDMPSLKIPSMFSGHESAGPNVTQDCPSVFIDNGASNIRVPADADAHNVRYQLLIDQTARECVVDGGNVVIKVGIEGGAVLGPVGTPGNFGAIIRVSLRNLKTYAEISSKTYRTTATIPANGTRGDFRLLADPIVAPMIGKRPQEDYEIIVGFAEGGVADTAEPRAKGGKKKGRRDAPAPAQDSAPQPTQ
jgi:hypothetical protein